MTCMGMLRSGARTGTRHIPVGLPLTLRGRQQAHSASAAVVLGSAPQVTFGQHGATVSPRTQWVPPDSVLSWPRVSRELQFLRGRPRRNLPGAGCFEEAGKGWFTDPHSGQSRSSSHPGDDCFQGIVLLIFLSQAPLAGTVRCGGGHGRGRPAAALAAGPDSLRLRTSPFFLGGRLSRLQFGLLP